VFDGDGKLVFQRTDERRIADAARVMPPRH